MKTATLLLDLPEMPSADFRIEVLCRGAGCEQFPATFVGVQINGRDLDRWEFKYPDTTDHSRWWAIEAPTTVMTTNRVELRFEIETPLSPKLWGRDDSRSIGIGLSALRIVTASESSVRPLPPKTSPPVGESLPARGEEKLPRRGRSRCPVP